MSIRTCRITGLPVDECDCELHGAAEESQETEERSDGDDDTK